MRKLILSVLIAAGSLALATGAAQAAWGDCLGPECADQRSGARLEPAGELLALQVVDATAEEASDSLSRLLGARVAFLPSDAEGTISLDLKEASRQDLVSFLSAQGALAIVEQPALAERGSDAAKPQRISLQASGIDGAGLARLLSMALGTDVQFRAAAPGEAYNLDIKGASRGELMAYLSRLGHFE